MRDLPLIRATRAASGAAMVEIDTRHYGGHILEPTTRRRTGSWKPPAPAPSASWRTSMTVSSQPVPPAALADLLGFLTGHLEVASPPDEHAVDDLRHALVRALTPDDIADLRQRWLSIDNADLYFAEAIAPAQKRSIAQAVERAVRAEKAPEERVLVRDVPVRSTQVPGSLPAWAAGAAVARTLGPFIAKDGRRLWFDFIRVTRLVALYATGRPSPLLLFSVSLPWRAPIPTLPPIVDAQRQYRLVPDSVWIDASLFAAAAPAGRYVGLKIKGGHVTTAAAPQLIDGRVTLPPGTRVDVALDLDPAIAFDTDPASPFGREARAATLTLPASFAFHSVDGSATVDAIGAEIAWNVYGQAADFRWQGGAPAWEPLLGRLMLPLAPSIARFAVGACASPFMTLAGGAAVERGAWALPAATLDILRPPPAAGLGGLALRAKAGISAQWPGLEGGAVALANPWLLADPGRIGLTDVAAGNVFCTQHYRLWQADPAREPTSVDLHYGAAFPFVFNTLAGGTEAYFALVDTTPRLDRPVDATGLPFAIRSKDTVEIVAVNTAWKLVSLYNDNILFDEYDPAQPKATAPKPRALALHNALFKVTPVNGFFLFGALADDYVDVRPGVVFLAFGVYAYVPALPDPYAANLGVLRAQFERVAGIERSGFATGQSVWVWLIAQIGWQPQEGSGDQVDVSFHFAPLTTAPQAAAIAAPGVANATQPPGTAAPLAAVPTALAAHPFMRLFAAAAAPPAPASAMTPMMFVAPRQPPDYRGQWSQRFGFLDRDDFALLDVSSNAHQMGVSFAFSDYRQAALFRTHAAVAAASADAGGTFPLQVRGLDVVARSQFLRAFAPPLVSWEPVLNLTPPEAGKFDPPQPVNYYPDDGGPTRIFNASQRLVPIAPLPLCDALVDSYAHESGNLTGAYVTLPFGLRSLAFLYRTNKSQADKPGLDFVAPQFDSGLTGGLQLKLTAGSGFNPFEDDLFRGFTMQVDNVLDLFGNDTRTTTLGEDVAKIFNRNFSTAAGSLDDQSGLPVTRLDVSGYGASTLSDWHNPKATFAQTSQARFDVLVGRTSHEVIQVRSVVYPWGIHVVRTVTLFRVGSGYVYRVDSGWKAESPGIYDFRFDYVKDPAHPDNLTTVSPYVIHPGVVKGLFDVRNIRTAVLDVAPFLDTMDANGFYWQDPSLKLPMATPPGSPPLDVDLQPVWFDADVELENVIQGQTNGRVPARRILGFVQLAPEGVPLTPGEFRKLLLRQLGAVGGPLDCIVDIGKGGQKLRVSAIDVNAAVEADGATPSFVAAARGSVVLPKDGAWSLVTHTRGSGDVTPLAAGTAVPLIRAGALDANLNYPQNALLRIANPADVVRMPGTDTVNFGFLQSTGTQKLLFLTPAYTLQFSDTVPGKLLSRTPPLFVDAYRLAGSKAVFPNIGDAETAFGSAVALTKNFATSALQDAGKNVLELLHVNSADGLARLEQDGYKLANAVGRFDLPTGPWFLIDEDYLKIYVEYAATTANGDLQGTTTRTGFLDYDIDSYAASVADRWKSKVANMAMVVDLGPFPRLLTIKGNFDAKMGATPGYVGDPADPTNFAAPQLELSDALEKAKEILQILAQLQGGDYADAVKRGLKIAMGNGADSWEYKFEASQEIPVLTFPPKGIDEDDPNAPLKLEASLKFGVYFNAALTTAALSDPKKLLPTAGAFLEFYGRLSVMCVSLSVATVYAVGQCTLQIGGDTKVGPVLDMKFGFGAQVVVGLPVVGNVSVMYMVGVEIHTYATSLAISAFLLFQGQAELVGGLIGVTITIEAKGTVARIADKTSCAAQVTFALDISVFLVIDIHFSKSWEESRQIA
jgi:hypothetical protein